MVPLLQDNSVWQIAACISDLMYDGYNKGQRQFLRNKGEVALISKL